MVEFVHLFDFLSFTASFTFGQMLFFRDNDAFKSLTFDSCPILLLSSNTVFFRIPRTAQLLKSVVRPLKSCTSHPQSRCIAHNQANDNVLCPHAHNFLLGESPLAASLRPCIYGEICLGNPRLLLEVRYRHPMHTNTILILRLYVYYE